MTQRDGQQRQRAHTQLVLRTARGFSRQRLADGETYLYDYLFDSEYNVTEATVTLPTGETKKFFFAGGKPLRK
jgi:hypothetical protein